MELTHKLMISLHHGTNSWSHRQISKHHNAAAAHVCREGFSGGHDQFLQPVQEHRAMAEAQGPVTTTWQGNPTKQG
jgi:hypothetical protein